MSEWKPGDTVTFTLTGTIAHINDGLATIEVGGIPLKVHISHILGTPEQAKRERIIAQLSNEFTDVTFESRPHIEHGSIIVMISHYALETERIEQIRSRIEELEQL